MYSGNLKNSSESSVVLNKFDVPSDKKDPFMAAVKVPVIRRLLSRPYKYTKKWIFSRIKLTKDPLDKVNNGRPAQEIFLP